MINRISIRNFKSLRDVSADWERFTVFVGPNASGKTSILQAVNLLCQAFHQSHPRGLGGGFGGGHDPAQVEKELIGSRSSASSEPVEVEAQSNGQRYRYLTHSSETLQNRGGQGEWTGQGPATMSGADEDGWEQWNSQQNSLPPLPVSILLSLEGSKLRDNTRTSLDSTAMAPDGSGLHSALANMTLNDPDAWQALQENLRQIIPTIRRLRHTKSVHGNPTSVLFDTVGADSLDANQVSEGTLLVLGLLAALHAPGRPSLIMMDDLDRGLHPKAQRELIGLLRVLLDTNSDLQIAATTHSPYMLDCMGVNEVRMTFLKEDGATLCAPLTSHPEYPKWKDEMTPGEMWSLFGEKWVEEIPA